MYSTTIALWVKIKGFDGEMKVFVHKIVKSNEENNGDT